MRAPSNLKTVDAFITDVARAKAEGFRAYKIHPPFLAGGEVDFKLDMEMAKAVRKTAGEDFPLLFDRVAPIHATRRWRSAICWTHCITSPTRTQYLRAI
jgi:L-alanine-DL-glutamate epimerase-like enolase superfamily enzyme